MKISIAFLILFLSCDLIAKPGVLQRHDLHALLTTNVIGMPSHAFNGRIHPGFEIGFTRRLSKSSKKNYLDYQDNIGYFSQRYLQQNLYFKPSLGYAIKTFKSLYLRPCIQSALILNRQKNQEFKYVGNGQYEKVSPYRFQFMPTFGLSAWFKAFEQKKYSLYPTFAYEFGMQLPFSGISSLLPINQFKAGIRLKHN